MTSTAYSLPPSGHAAAVWPLHPATQASQETAAARENPLVHPAASRFGDAGAPTVRIAGGWAARLIARDDDGAPRPREEALRFTAGLGLAAIYGVALGARAGGAALFVHAAGTPAALLTVGAMGVPAFAIVLALLNAPIDGARLTAVTARAVATTGLVLAGLAPAALLFALTSSTAEGAAGAALLGLSLAGGLGLAKLLAGLQRALASAEGVTRLLAFLASLGFGLFAIALAARVWSATLPALGTSGGAP
jgi:hypothetical protein